MSPDSRGKPISAGADPLYLAVKNHAVSMMPMDANAVILRDSVRSTPNTVVGSLPSTRPGLPTASIIR